MPLPGGSPQPSHLRGLAVEAKHGEMADQALPRNASRPPPSHARASWIPKRGNACSLSPATTPLSGRLSKSAATAASPPSTSGAARAWPVGCWSASTTTASTRRDERGELYHDSEVYDEEAEGLDTLPFLRETIRKADLKDTALLLVTKSAVAAQVWDFGGMVLHRRRPYPDRRRYRL